MKLPVSTVNTPAVTYLSATTEHALLVSKHIQELQAFAERVARLNRDAGEIGPGMLASLVDEARRLIS